MQLKHTKGPWKILDNGGGLEKVGVANPDKSNWFIAEEILPDDARLISCAPEMLEGLIFALKYSEDKIMGTNKFMPDDFYRNVTSVIEKATGLTIEEVLS